MDKQASASTIRMLWASHDDLPAHWDAVQSQGRVVARRAASAEDAVETAMREDFDAVVLDLALAGIGAGAASDILHRAGSPALVLGMARAGANPTDEAHAARFDAILTAPLDFESVAALVARRRGDGIGAQIDSWMANECEDLVLQFRESLPGTLDSIEAALAASDRVALHSILHKLKGVAGSFGFPAITADCLRVERHLREDASDGAFVAVGELIRAIRADLQSGTGHGIETQG